jgi:hypothetical protein
LIVSKELSVFLTASQFSITSLTDIWDCVEGVYQYGTRGKGEKNINEPCVSLIGASAQDYLVSSIPADAVGGGFTRRVNFVFATKKEKKVAWPQRNGCNIFHNQLVEDLKHIALIRGEFKIGQKTKDVFETYHNSCEANEFDDSATASYKSSKSTNVQKLMMCFSASRSDSLEINENDFNLAVQLTEEVSENLKIVFRAVGESPLVVAQDKVLRFIETRGYATRQEMLSVSWHDITSDDLDRVIATLREAGVISEKQVGKKTLYYITKGTVSINP